MKLKLISDELAIAFNQPKTYVFKTSNNLMIFGEGLEPTLRNIFDKLGHCYPEEMYIQYINIEEFHPGVALALFIDKDLLEELLYSKQLPGMWFGTNKK